MDVSHTVERYKIKQHNELLNLINATVSHELRNPLNSISSQNIENKVLFERMSTILDSEFIEDFQIENLKKIIVKLKKGREVQYASTKLMNSLIQDLLDYA